MIDCQNCRERVSTLTDVKTNDGIESRCDVCLEQTISCAICRQPVDFMAAYLIDHDVTPIFAVCREDLVTFAARESTPSLSGATESVRL